MLDCILFDIYLAAVFFTGFLTGAGGATGSTCFVAFLTGVTVTGRGAGREASSSSSSVLTSSLSASELLAVSSLSLLHSSIHISGNKRTRKEAGL